ncbi:hypothetical protein BTS2_2229 [Bacillus sp. TS-2]|nr:hypothetical protein BTS2_2229 [Bacillus sp. TS-2]
MAKDPIEENLNTLKKQYDKIPSQNTASSIMNQIKKENQSKDYSQSYWKFGSIAACIILFITGGLVFQMISSNEQEMSSEAESSGEIMMLEESDEVVNYDAELEMATENSSREMSEDIGQWEEVYHPTWNLKISLPNEMSYTFDEHLLTIYQSDRPLFIIEKWSEDRDVTEEYNIKQEALINKEDHPILSSFHVPLQKHKKADWLVEEGDEWIYYILEEHNQEILFLYTIVLNGDQDFYEREDMITKMINSIKWEN